MSGMEAANLQMLARFYDAQREWLGNELELVNIISILSRS
jgi:hypothetical protein